MSALPYRRLAGFYFFYFAYLGAFAPFFTLYLDAVGMSSVEIGVLMSLPATHAYRRAAFVGLAGRSRRQRLARLRSWAGLAGTVSWLGVYAGTQFAWLFAVLLAVMFFWSAALPLVEATHAHASGRRDRALRPHSRVGFGRIYCRGDRRGLRARRLAAAGGAGDCAGAMMLCMLALCWAVPDAKTPPHASDASADLGHH